MAIESAGCGHGMENTQARVNIGDVGGGRPGRGAVAVYGPRGARAVV